MKRSMIALGVLAVLFITGSVQATFVALVPDTLNVSPGSNVDVSVYMDVSSPITMAAISTNILYDANVFSYDANSIVAKGALLTHDWSLYGGETATLRVGGIDLNVEPWYEDLATGSGVLFTFTLQVKGDAPLGLSALNWGVYDGYNNADAGFDYGDKDFADIILLNSEMSGASINVIPEPATMSLLALGGLAILRRGKK